MLAPEKTKLLAFAAPRHKTLIQFTKLTSKLEIQNTEIQFSDTAEHVGIVRSSSGNLPHILDRVAAHRKALYAVLAAGVARRHNANPAAGIKVQNTFALPVLLSGIASLTLNASEFLVLDKHFKESLRSIMKLPDKTPDPVIYFLAGTLPIKAHIHRKQLSIFGMISRLPNNILHKIATHVLSTDPDNSKSWFIRIRLLCKQYSLPSPLKILLSPPSKEAFNKLVKSRVLDYWETSLRAEAATKSSLIYFKPEFMSLSNPHPMFLTCSSNPFETNKSITQASLLSGRFKTDYLSRHWVKDNPEGYCILCTHLQLQDTLEHFLILCNHLSPTRLNILKYWQNYTDKDDILRNLILVKLRSSIQTLMQFLIDPSADADVIQGVQRRMIRIEDIYKLTRTWCYALKRKKLQLTGRFRKL